MYNTESVAPVKDYGIRRAVINKNAQSEKSVGYEMTAQLLPFKFTMRKQLKRRGYNVDFMPMKLLIPLYYNEFVSNKNNNKNKLVPINCFEFAENPVFRFSTNDNLNGDMFSHSSRQQFNHVASVVDNIIDNFKRSKLKKQSLGLSNFDVKDSLTDDEKIQANAAIQVEKNLQNKLIGNSPITIKGLITIIFMVGIFYLLLYMSK